jgi:hypothetical protein
MRDERLLGLMATFEDRSENVSGLRQARLPSVAEALIFAQSPSVAGLCPHQPCRFAKKGISSAVRGASVTGASESACERHFCEHRIFRPLAAKSAPG